jgi:competence protein ComEA
LIVDNETVIEEDKAAVSSLININTSSLDELLTLNGIGESKAVAIIEYRKNNKFTKIEDLMNVSGIGEALYNKVKDSITV